MIPYGQKDFPHQARPQADPYDTHKELTAMNILPACAADTAKIYRIMTEARSLAPDPGWYCTDSEEYIRSHIVNPDEGIVFKAVEHDCLAAATILLPVLLYIYTLFSRTSHTDDSDSNE